MIHTEASVLIDRPIAVVFAMATDLDRARSWRKGLAEVGLTSDGPVRLGSTYRWVVKFGWQSMDLSGEITGWDPPISWTWKPLAGPFPVTGGMTFADEDGSTRVTTYSDSEPQGLMKLMSPIMKSFGERQYRQELLALRDLLEADDR